MSFFKLNNGEIVNQSLIESISFNYEANNINYHMSSGLCLYEKFSSLQQYQARMEEIQKLLGVEE